MAGFLLAIRVVPGALMPLHAARTYSGMRRDVLGPSDPVARGRRRNAGGSRPGRSCLQKHSILLTSLRVCSFQTLVTPDATEAYKRHAQKKGWGANGIKGRGRPDGGGGGGRPRFGGMSNVRSIDHSERPAAS